MKLINKEELSDEAIQALDTVFDRFSENKSFLTLDELQCFAKKTNGEPFTAQELDQIKDFFDCTEDGFMTKRGFREMYETQSIADASETIKDLKTHGFDFEE
ncbi:hypothetical protein EDD86DRAFT_207618 [Gorgonomyces haynaldii]|nr:hypothetical protein EDD86DRAFT_207618 [Gorgonomyces haynaldii]